MFRFGQIKVSTWCRACEFRRPRLQRNVTRARDGEIQTESERNARPRLGPQQLPTKAVAKSTPSFHSILVSNPIENCWNWTRAATRERWWKAGGERQHTFAAWHPLPHCYLSCCFHWPLCSLWRRTSLPEQLSDTRSAVSQGSRGRQTFIPSTAIPLLLQPSRSISATPSTARAHPLMRKLSRIHLSTHMLLVFVW